MQRLEQTDSVHLDRALSFPDRIEGDSDTDCSVFVTPSSFLGVVPGERNNKLAVREPRAAWEGLSAMSPAALRALSVVNGWETVRYELLQTRLCDLGVNVEDNYVADYIERLYHELDSKKLVFQPRCYLTDGWGCPDEVPIIGMPFYLADRRLSRLEE